MSDPIRVGGGYSTCDHCGIEYHNSIFHECDPLSMSQHKTMSETTALSRKKFTAQIKSHWLYPLTQALIEAVEIGTRWDEMKAQQAIHDAVDLANTKIIDEPNDRSRITK